MHGNVAGDVMEDIGLGQIIELVGVADGDGGWEGSLAEAIEEDERGDIAGYAFRLESGQRLEEAVYVFEARYTVRLQDQGRDAFQEVVVGVFFPLGLHARVEQAPGFVILRRIKLVGLLDKWLFYK